MMPNTMVLLIAAIIIGTLTRATTTEWLLMAAIIAWNWARGDHRRGPAWTRSAPDATGMDAYDALVFGTATPREPSSSPTVHQHNPGDRDAKRAERHDGGLCQFLKQRLRFSAANCRARACAKSA